MASASRNRSASTTLVTAPRNQASGSELYMSVKSAAAQFDDLDRIARDGANFQLGMIKNAASITDSMIAGVGMINPWLAPWLPRISPVAAQYEAAARSMMSLWSNGKREIQEPEWLSSPQHADHMITFGKTMPADTEVNQKLNGKFFTHHSAPNAAVADSGALIETKPADIRSYFDPNIPKEQWPNLILTSSHALVRDHQDVSSTLEGFHNLITHCYSNIPGVRADDLPLIRDIKNPPAPPASGKPTIMVATVQNDHNAWVNGGLLLKRLWQLDQMHQKSDELMSQTELEEGYLKDISPAAARLSKLIFSMIVEDPRGIDLDAPNLITPREPFRLRADAPEVLQHIKLAGYSKGGNIVTDAVRYLILQLQHEGAVEVPLALAPNAPHQPQQTHVPMPYDAIAPLIRNTGILCVNPGICPLTEREQELGMRRISIRNSLDRITGHLFRKYHRDVKLGTHDDVYVINGQSMGDLGHSMDAALGTISESGYLTDKSKVDEYSVATQQLALSRMQAFFASCYHKIGVSDVAFDPAKPDELAIEFSTGASDARIRSCTQAMIDAMEQAGLAEVSISPRTHQRFAYTLHFAPCASIKETKEKLIEGFGLIQNTHTNVFVSGTVFLGLGSKDPTPYIDAGSAALDSINTRTTQTGARRA